MSTEYYDLFTDGYSSCCGARVYSGGLCADCKEHCSVEYDEDGDK